MSDVNARTISALIGVALLLGGSVAVAGSDSVWQRLRGIHPRAEQYSVDVPDSRIKAGGARAFVKAPIATTMAVVTDYANYKKMNRRYEQAEDVGKHGDQTDVAVRVPILKGRARVKGTLRFDPPRQVGDETVIVGRMIDGNVKRFEATFRLKKVDDANTQLSLEMLINPSFPAPGSLVTTETADAADGTVRRLRGYSERRFLAGKG